MRGSGVQEDKEVSFAKWGLEIVLACRAFDRKLLNA